MRVRLPLVQTPQGWGVDLPTWAVVPGSYRPVTPGLLGPDGVLPAADSAQVAALNPTVLVDVPDEYAGPAPGRISLPRLRALYRGNPKWDRDSYTPPGS